MRERERGRGGEGRGTKLVGEWRGTFALAASDVGDEMTNNGRSVGGRWVRILGSWREGRGRGKVDAAAAEGNTTESQNEVKSRL